MLIALQITVKYSVLQKRTELAKGAVIQLGSLSKRKQNYFGVKAERSLILCTYVNIVLQELARFL